MLDSNYFFVVLSDLSLSIGFIYTIYPEYPDFTEIMNIKSGVLNSGYYGIFDQERNMGYVFIKEPSQEEINIAQHIIKLHQFINSLNIEKPVIIKAQFVQMNLERAVRSKNIILNSTRVNIQFINDQFQQDKIRIVRPLYNAECYNYTHVLQNKESGTYIVAKFID